MVKIKVAQFTVGIVGLKAALEEAMKKNFSSDHEVVEYLLEQLKAKNYIPPSSEADYAQAFLREYKKYKGEDLEAEKSHGLDVKVLGPGCPNCDRLEQMVYKVMAEEHIVGIVEHVKDLKEGDSFLWTGGNTSFGDQGRNQSIWPVTQRHSAATMVKGISRKLARSTGHGA